MTIDCPLEESLKAGFSDICCNLFEYLCSHYIYQNYFYNTTLNSIYKENIQLNTSIENFTLTIPKNYQNLIL